MSSSLSADTKDALARDLPDAAHCRSALLDGLVLYGTDARGRFATHRNAVARLFRSLARERLGEVARVGSSGGAATRARSFMVNVPSELLLEPRKPSNKCDRAIEVRAALLACGSLAAGSHGYHLEFVVDSAAHADRLAFMLRSIGREPKRMRRKGRNVLYYKDFDAIGDVLTTVGAFGAVLHLEDVRALRETKNRIHRLVNTEAANLERAASAAAAQQRTIAFIASAYGIVNLTPALREIAQLRMANPEETLSELGRRCNPQIGKPTVNSRLASLARLAARLKAGPSASAARKGTRDRVR
jgi:hypothetical protein